jgi:D-3-phosphoglycerate dehydrogenase
VSLRVLVPEPLGEEGLALLAAEPGVEPVVLEKPSRAELLRAVAAADALIVRSATGVDAELLAAAPRLQVVVRAGTGIDNVDLDAATARGVVVMNTPGGNTNAATELTLALLLALARRIPQANRSLAAGLWEREKFVGWELAGKVLGVVGLGRIGSEVAARARAFRMEVQAHDPFISREAAAARGLRLVALDELIATSDVVTLHVPLGAETKRILGQDEMARMKPGAVIVNCARGGLVDEEALRLALESGHLGGAALDVFETEPKPDPRLIAHPHVVATPHLGASTQEAQASVGIQAARQAIGVLRGTSFENAINVPLRDAALLGRIAPYLALAEKMGACQVQLVPGGVREVAIDVAGELEDTTAIRLAFLKGFLRPITGAGVNYVNAPYLARERGIRVSESRSTAPADYASVVTTRVVTDLGKHRLRGTVLANRAPRLIEIDGFAIDAIPEGNLIVCRSLDRPGVIGELGTCLGRNQLNISEFRLGRAGPGQEALSVITLDAAPTTAALDQLRRLDHVLSVRAITL